MYYNNQGLNNVGAGVPLGIQKAIYGLLVQIDYVSEVVKISHNGVYSSEGVHQNHRHFCANGGYFLLNGKTYTNENGNEFNWWWCNQCKKLIVQKVF